MNLLLKLPDDIVIDIFSSWCELKEVTLFDSAVCNVHYRKSLLNDIFTSNGFVFSQTIQPTLLSILWIDLRGVKVDSIHFVDNKIDTLIGREKLLESLNLSRLTRLQFGLMCFSELNVTNEVVAKTVNRCPCLNSLIVRKLKNVTFELFDYVEKY